MVTLCSNWQAFVFPQAESEERPLLAGIDNKLDYQCSDSYLPPLEDHQMNPSTFFRAVNLFPEPM